MNAIEFNKFKFHTANNKQQGRSTPKIDLVQKIGEK